MRYAAPAERAPRCPGAAAHLSSSHSVVLGLLMPASRIAMSNACRLGLQTTGTPWCTMPTCAGKMGKACECVGG